MRFTASRKTQAASAPGPNRWLTAAVTVAFMLVALAAPSTASAHGPVAPVATSYLATVRNAPAGVVAKVVDGYVRMWLHVQPTHTVVVLDYRGVPYLRFSPSGVEVNHNSEMFYLNQVPVARVPKTVLTGSRAPRWSRVSSGHSYEWHDGRLQALAETALAPGTRYVGRWTIPLLAAGRSASLGGALWYRPRPSPLWFWPVAVIVLCVLAAWRVRSDRLDSLATRALAGGALAATTTAAVGLGLHGRPGLQPYNVAVMALVLGFVVWGARRLLTRPPGAFGFLMIATVAIWEGISLVPTLRDGFVVIAIPATIARIAAVICLGTAIGLLPFTFRLAARRAEDENESSEEPVLSGAADSALHA